MKPILFNTDMVKAILDGRKTVTRRTVKPHRKAIIENMWFDKNDGEVVVIYNDNFHIGEKGYIKKPYQVGDILYVRETWCDRWLPDGFLENENRYGYKADGVPSYGYWGNDKQGKDNVWIPSIHMPKKAARIFLKVTDIRVERLQDIAIKDIAKEGFSRGHAIDETWYDRGKKDFQELWNSIIKKSNIESFGWDANPWVWVIEFEKISKEEADGK